jgi:hypothetical protein
MTLSLDAVPGVLEPPVDAKPSQVWTAPPAWSRRRILAAVGGAAVAAGVAALDLLPWSKPRAAFAAAYTAWSTCHGFYNANTTCVPTNAYFNSQNCSGSWHRNDGSSGTCYVINWTHLATTCDGHNAWRWTGGGPNRKCSDGRYHYRDCGGGAIDRFSICRTAI